MYNEKGKKNYSKENNYIVLHDKYMFKDLKIPNGATNFMLWYKKNDHTIWGLTIKQLNPADKYDNQHVWKSTWYSNNNKLTPTTGSVNLGVTEITDDLYDKLYEIVNDNIKK